MPLFDVCYSHLSTTIKYALPAICFYWFLLIFRFSTTLLSTIGHTMAIKRYSFSNNEMFEYERYIFYTASAKCSNYLWQDPRAVLIGLLLIISAFQYLNQFGRYSKVCIWNKNSKFYSQGSLSNCTLSIIFLSSKGKLQLFLVRNCTCYCFASLTLDIPFYTSLFLQGFQLYFSETICNLAACVIKAFHVHTFFQSKLSSISFT